MHFRFAAPIVFAAAGLGMSAAAVAAPEPALKISAPLTHENLSVYFVRGKSIDGPAPATLEEALAKGSVVVHETGNVRELKIENKGSEPVFVQIGDLVKGGQQDRVLTTSLLIPPNSGELAIGAYCVEQGRWTSRGMEDSKKFSASNAQLFSRTAKVAIARAPIVEREAQPAQGPAARPERGSWRDGLGTEPLINQVRPSVEPPARDPQRITQQARPRGGSGQGEVWNSVAAAQASLATRLAAPVASDKSKTSLQLTIENERLQKAQADFVAAIEAKGSADGEVVGVVIAINGQIASADIYPSHALLKKMWPKLVRAAATEAIANPAPNPAKDKTAAPAISDVETFLTAAERGEAHTRALGGIAQQETKESANVLKVEARTSDGRWYHRNFLSAK